MAELTPAERLQPCLLDRLTDNEPQVQREGRHERVVSMAQYRKAVLRDLEMLLNSRRLPAEDSVYDYPEVATSVLNYGIPDMCAKTESGITQGEFDKHVKQAILHYEPRILSNSLTVRIVTPEDAQGQRTLGLEIEGDLWAQPFPDHLFVKTEVDLESGHCTLKGESIG